MVTLGTLLALILDHMSETETYRDLPSLKKVVAFAFARNGLTLDVSDKVTVEFSRRLQTTLGNARGLRQLIRLNANLWIRATTQERYETTIHEACHLVMWHIYRRRMGHGSEWRAAMRKCGVKPTRTHNVDTEGFDRKQKRYPVKCTFHTHMVTGTMLRKIAGGQRRRCRTCKTLLRIEG